MKIVNEKSSLNPVVVNDLSNRYEQLKLNEIIG